MIRKLIHQEDALFLMPIVPVFLLAIILYVLLSALTFAQGEDSPNSIASSPLKLEEGTKVEVDSAPGSFFKQMDNEFQIRGQITSFSQNQLVVDGQTIIVDPSLTEDFQQKGLLRVGVRVQIEGIIQNGQKIAQEINVLGQGSGRFKFREENAGIGESSANSDLDHDGGPMSNVSIKAVGPAAAVMTFLQQILDYLKSLIKI